MTFLRRSFFVAGLGLLLLVGAPRRANLLHAQSQPPAPQTATAPEGQTTPQPAYQLPPDKLAKAIALSRIRNVMDIVNGLWGLAVLWLLLATGLSAGIESWARGLARRRWIQGAIFFAAFMLITWLASLPLGWFSQSKEKSYGISVQNWGSWLGDQAKALGLALAIAVPILLLFNWIVRRWPRRYWVGVWLATVPIIVFLIFLSPLLEPIFNKFEPLETHHAGLVAKLETVVARTGINIPPSRMYLMKASEKYNGINAYVTGVGATKRYVMWDTATDRLPDDEVLFVFGHESGHYVLKHIPKLIAGMCVALFFVYWACAAFAAWLARRFGARWKLDVLDSGNPLASRTGFVVLLFAISVASFFLEPVSNTFSRHFEHQADVYGQEAVHGIVADPQRTAVSGFNHLGEAWLEDPSPSPFIEFWEFNHPSVQTRANFALHYDPWANGGRGEFFEK
jgi:Zn-dependent protease with chaperone function